MSKLVDKERLSKLAKALDERSKNLVNTETERALAVEQGLRNDLTSEIARATGKERELHAAITEEVATRVSEITRVEDLVNAETERSQQAETGLGQRIDSLNTKVTEVESNYKSEDAKLSGRISVVEELVGVENGEGPSLSERLNIAEEAIEEIVSINEEQATKIQANTTSIDGVKSDLNKEISDRKTAVQEVQASVNTVAQNLADEVENRTQAIQEAKTELETAISTGDAKALKDAKEYADTKIAALVDTAPEALNTLGELAKAIKDHESEYEAYVST